MLKPNFTLRAPDAPPSGGGGNPPAPAPAPSLLSDGNPPPAPAPDGNAPPAPAPSALPANWDSTIYDATGKLNADALKALPSDMADLTGFLGKYGTRADALKAIPHLQKLALGKAGLKPLPADATPEARAAFNAEIAKVLGVPDKPEGYGITKPDNLPEGMTWDDKSVSGFLALAKEHNVTPSAAKAIIAYQQQLTAAQLAASKEQGAQAVATAVAEMKAELPPGADWAAHVAQVDRGVATASRISGIPVERLNELAKAGGLKDMSKLFASLAAASGEDAMPDAAHAAHGAGVDEAIAKLEANPKLWDRNAPIEVRQPLEAEYKNLLARKHGYSR
jgi:hypothetical protein